ncbi:MAG: hypothetical protein GY847_07415 [Proteobacteria bacterium]|nr:hypothetical protein [Pseudomonadota bacterium]
MKKTTVWMAIVIFSCSILVAGLAEVAAGSPPSVFGGKVFLLKKRPPSYFRSKGGFVKFIRRNSIKVVYENEDREWNFQTMSFFKRPLGDYEVEMVFYNIEKGRSKGRRHFVDSFTQYTQDRNTRSLSGKTKLIRPSFDANIRYMVIAQSHGIELAKGEFSTKGTSQAAIDQQKRYEKIQKDMEKSMKELEKKAKEQEQQQKKDNKKAADELF